jgi:hypothetical protein
LKIIGAFGELRVSLSGKQPKKKKKKREKKRRNEEAQTPGSDSGEIR